MIGRLPEYDELPTSETLGLPHGWDAFGRDDQLGAFGRLGPDKVLHAVQLVRDGTVWNLSVPLTAIDPPMYAREPLEHTIFQVDRNTWDDRLDSFYLQSSSHWDGLRHIQARELGHWGGRTDAGAITAGAGPLGIEHWVRHGIVGRGVLLDVAHLLDAEQDAYDPFAPRSIAAETLATAAERQGVTVQDRDILCARLGWMSKYKALEREAREAAAGSHEFTGLAADEGMARWLWNNGVAAVAADNPAVEVSPGDRDVGSLHRRLIPMLGIALGELFDFDALADACHADGRWDFLFVSVPLYLPGGVGSPANAIALR